MTTLQQLKQIIHQSDPSILDLVFGCEIEMKVTAIGFSENSRTIVAKSNEFGKEYRCLNEKLDTFCYFNKEDIKEILGRPITLLDIKQCLMYNGYSNKEFNKVSDLWIKPNSLDEQSDNLKTILYEYLKNKIR